MTENETERAQCEHTTTHDDEQYRTDGGEQATVADTKAVTASIDTRVLEQYLEYIDAVTEEAIIEFQQDGLHCYTTDATNVSLVHAHINESRFDEYDAIDINIGIAVYDIKQILDWFGDTVSIQVDASESTIAFMDEATFYETSYLDPDNLWEGTADRQWETTTEVYLTAHQLQRAVKLAGDVSDSIRFQYDSDGVLTIGADADTDTVRVELDLQAVPEDGDGQGLYTKSYLTDMLDVIPEGAGVNVSLGDTVPMEMRVSQDQVAADFAVAPRITGDDI